MSPEVMAGLGLQGVSALALLGVFFRLGQVGEGLRQLTSRVVVLETKDGLHGKVVSKAS